jgi:diguanylate cyclase
MDKNSKSIEIARQTLIQLTARKIPPTPDNYRSVYDEISGVTSIDHSKELARTLDTVLHEAGQKQPKYLVMAQAIASQVEKHEWAKLEDQLRKLIPVADGDISVTWPMVLRNLIRQLEVSHKGITITRKKEGLNRVLTNFGQDPDVLAQKIHALVNSWGQGVATEGAIDTPASASPIGAKALEVKSVVTTVADSVDIEPVWRDMMTKTLDLVLLPMLQSNPVVEKRAKGIQEKIAAAKTPAQVREIADGLKSVLFTLEMYSDTQNRTQEALLQLLRLLLSSMAELVVEDKWLHGQIQLIHDILQQPVNIDALYNAESSLKELIFKQGKIKPGLIDAQETIKKMAATFVDRLVDLAESTDDYQAKIQGYQDSITTTKDIHELNKLLSSLMEDTRVMGLSAQRSRDVIREAEQKVKEAELKIIELTNQLEHISEVAHEDYLTGTLNRRGMDEALEREFSRSDRYNVPLSIAMMDIDHFKRLNDTLGHATGDQALAHLARVMKETLRTTDVIARYGGEEFIIILPGTAQAEGIHIVTRAQRELTKNFFMHNNERVLITFSAGVAERLPGEEINSVIPRADLALYKAKHSGRNRVIGADIPPPVADAADSVEE